MALLFAVAAVLLVAAALPMLLLAAFVLLQCRLARRTPRTCEAAVRPRPALAVLVPAHDEAALIGETLASIAPRLHPRDRLLVVADNCEDDTAGVAARAGAEVVVRHDPQHRSKGYALAAGLRHLRADAPEIVVVVDADCVVCDGALDALAAACAASGGPVQALYRMELPREAPLPARLGQLGWILKNQTRPAGMAAIGGPCSLFGSGMALPWPLAADADLEHDRLVEDMELGLDLACAGHAPRFVPAAEVRSRFPAGAAGRREQARRWEYGHVELIARKVPAALRLAWRRRDRDLALLAADIAVPPPTWLALALAFVAALAAALLPGRGHGVAAFAAALALAMALLALACLLAAAASNWRQHGRDLVTPAEWLLVPALLTAKVPFVIAAFGARRLRWRKSSRNSD